MSHIFRALTAEPWAIEPSWLPFLAALAQRDAGHPEVQARAAEWQQRDYRLMAGSAAQPLAGTQRAFIQDGVAILPLTGPIFPRANMMTQMSGATSVATFQSDYRAALASADVGAIMLLVDSPGGQVPGVANLAAVIAAGAKKKLTVAQVTGSGASAAYWLLSAASEVYLDRTALVGSIGVVAAVPKQVAPDSEGFIDIEIVSSNAPNKRVDPESEDGQAQIRATLDAMEGEFIADVAKYRNTTATRVKSEFMQGGVAVGAAAVNAGMADKVQSQDATQAYLARHAANQAKLNALRK
ncbi:MAG: S49 family peptidase [Rhizomicrobium sp.]